MINSQFRGMGVAMVTPFKEDYSIDFDALAKLTKFLIAERANYIVVLGTTGETATLNKDEKKLIYKKIKEVASGSIPLVAGIGGNNTSEVIETIKAFDFAGYDAVLSVSPYYNKPNQEGIFQHYKAISAASPKPVIIYNVPGRTGSNITAATQLRIANLPNIAGTKEASGNLSQVMEIIAKKPENLLVLSGDDAFTYPFMALGMEGVISVIGNAFPRDFSEMIKLCLNGKWHEARNIHYKLLELMEAIFEDGSPGGVKVLLNQLGICGTTVRLPLANVNKATEEKLLKLIKNY